MQNQKLKKLKDTLVDVKTEPKHEDVTTSDERPLVDPEVELGKTEIKGSDGFSLLGVVMETAFFFTFFEYIAARQFDSRRRSLRIAKIRSMHPKLYLCCIWLDFTVRLIVVTAIVLLAIYAAYKVVK